MQHGLALLMIRHDLGTTLTLDEKLHTAANTVRLDDPDDVPTEYRYSGAGSSTFSRCATAKSRRSPSRASWTASTVPGRPAEIGTATPG